MANQINSAFSEYQHHANSIQRGLKTEKKPIDTQSIADLCRINEAKSQILRLQNDSDSLAEVRREAESSCESIEQYVAAIDRMDDVMSQLLSNTGDNSSRDSLINNFKQELSNYDLLATSGGFDGSEQGAAKIGSAGSNKFSAIDASEIYNDAVAPYTKAGTQAGVAKAFTINVRDITDAATIEVAMGGQTITEKYVVTSSTTNESNSFGESVDASVRAKNLAESIYKSSSSTLREIFDIQVTGVDKSRITFTPKATLSNYAVTVNSVPLAAAGGDGVGINIIAGTNLNVVEMRLLQKTENKTLGGFTNTGFAEIGNVAGNRATHMRSRIHILADVQIGINGGNGDAIGTLTATGGANKAIYNRLYGMGQANLSTIIKDLAWLYNDAAAAKTNGFGGGSSHIDVIRTTITAKATANNISQVTADFINANFFAGDMANAGNAAVDTYGADGGNGNDSLLGANLHGAGADAQSLIRYINKLVTTAYFKKALGGDNGFISSAARAEIAGNVAGLGGGTLDATAGDFIYTFKTTYNGKNYVGITGRHNVGYLDDAGRAIYFFEADGISGLPADGADIAFKVNFAGLQNAANINDAGELVGLLNNKSAQFNIGMKESNSSAHVSVKGKNLSSYTEVTGAEMKQAGSDAILRITIGGADFICKKALVDINTLGFGSKLTFTNATNATDSIVLTITDQGNSGKSLFRDDSGNAVGNENFKEVASKFSAFFLGKALGVKTSSGIVIKDEKADLRLAAIADYAKLTDISKDKGALVKQELVSARNVLLAELAKHVSTEQSATSIINFVGSQSETMADNLSQLEDIDSSTESVNLQDVLKLMNMIRHLVNMNGRIKNMVDNKALNNLNQAISLMLS